MKNLNTLLVATATVLVSACTSPKNCGTSCASKSSAACSSSAVPANILAAAQARVPGFAMTSYDTDTDNGRKVYELNGTANGRKCEVKVDATGKVLKIDRD